MIRRESLAVTSTTGETMTGAELAARQVKRGESVRIVGLGSLSAVPYGDIRKGFV